MFKSTKRGSGIGQPLGIGRYELPAKAKSKPKGESIEVIGARIATQRRAAWAEFEDGKPEAWIALRIRDFI